MAIPLEGYESVAERIEKFWAKYPNGRIDVQLIHHTGDRYIIQTAIYKDMSDSAPFATDFAEEIRSATNRFPLENCSTSSIGRALHTGGLSKFSENHNRPSLEEMKRVERPVERSKEALPTGAYDPWDMSQAVAEVGGILTGRSCQHGVMVRKEGVSKVGKAYKGWVCPDNNRACAIWE